MLVIPIQWKFRYNSYVSGPKLNLNSEFTLSVNCKCVCVQKYKVDFIGISWKKYWKIASISGMLLIQVSYKKLYPRAFSKLIDSNTTFEKLIDQNTDIIVYEGGYFSLHGVINIIFFGENFGNDFETKACKIYYQSMSVAQLTDDLGRLLDPQTSNNSDVILKCGTTSIPAHKLILSARSPVFSAIFKNTVEEIRQNEVDITDIDASVVQAMITYIYTAKTSGLTVSSASDLLFAADKYQLLDLKKVCCDYLKENISLKIVVKILILGDLCAEDLKSFAINYLCKSYRNFSEFKNIEEWQTLRSERPDLALEILESLLKWKDLLKFG